MMNEFIFPVKAYIEDTDYGGVVYHSNYIKYYERARSEWATQIGMGIEWQNEHKIYFVVRAINIEYLKPVRLFETVEVVSQITAIKQSSVTFRQYLRSPLAPDTILNTAEVRIVCVNEAFRPQALPPCPLQDILTGEKT
jgi:acyl-CoA thioester hydrolase